jgi:ribosomal protein S18 acetylase RimI-like enzyme
MESILAGPEAGHKTGELAKKCGFGCGGQRCAQLTARVESGRGGQIMPIRSLSLPRDLLPAADMLAKAFQYPDHPEWGIQSDEQEQLVETIRRMRRIWPVVRLLQTVSPVLRDIARGFVWEENGSMVGLTIAQREGTTKLWTIGTVGVLPEFRRRGIARQLVAATLDMVRSRGGTQATLGVIHGNTPAQALYRSLGFVDYTGGTVYSLTPAGTVDQPALPPGYEEAPLAEFDWRTRYDLAKRIVPEEVQRFQPVVPGRYRAPWVARVLAPIFRFAEGARDHDIVLRRTLDRVTVARAGWTISKSDKGTNSIRVTLDPAHADLALYLVRRALSPVLAKKPGLRVMFSVPTWMPAVAREAEGVGFVPRTVNKLMGIEI